MTKHKTKKYNKKNKEIVRQEDNDIGQKGNDKMSDENSYKLITRILDVMVRAMFKLTLSDAVYFSEARKQLLLCLKHRKEYAEEKFRLVNYKKEWEDMKRRENKKERDMIKRTRRIKRSDVDGHDIRAIVNKQIEDATED